MPFGLNILFKVCLGLILVGLVVGFFKKHNPNPMFTDQEKGQGGGGGGKKKGFFGKLFGKKGGGGGGPAAQ